MARQSVEEELSHHRPGNATRQSSSPRQPDKEPAPRQEYRNDNQSTGNRYVASPKQQQFIASLVKGVKGLDWKTFDRYCDSKWGKACSQLTSKEASMLIQDLQNAKSSGGLSA